MKRLSTAALLVCLLSIPARLAHGQDPAFHAGLRDNLDNSGASYGDTWGGSATLAVQGRYGQDSVDLVDVSDPDNLSVTTNFSIPSPNTGVSAQDVKTGTVPLAPSTLLAFIGLEYGGADGVLIADVSNPASPVALTRIDVSPGTYTDIHNLSYRGDGWLAICDSRDSDIAILDLRGYDPASPPSQITSWTYNLTGLGTGFVHDLTFDGNRLYVSEWDSFMVYDVSGLGSSAPSFVGSVRGVASHAVWGTADGLYAVTTEERGGGAARLYEVDSGGMNLYQVDSFVNPASGAYSSTSVHNPVVLGDRVYVADYEGGVVVLQIDRTSKTLEKVASYDTTTSSPGGFNGCWGVYPLLGVDRVLASDISNGLFTIDFSALQIRFPSARPRVITPITPQPIAVEIDELGNASLSTVSLYTSVDGAPFTSSAMTNTGGNVWEGSLPAIGCGSQIDYYVAASDVSTEVYTSPADAPTGFHTAWAALGLVPVFEDDFETDKGWTVTDVAVTRGTWERGVPVDSGAQPGHGDPQSLTGSSCYITENASVGASTGTADVDGGPTRLESPDLDFSGGDGLISYRRWAFSDDVDPNDALLVEISNDGGGNWTTAETAPMKAGGWLEHAFRVSDFVTPTASVRVRFSISDNPNDGVVEGGVDTFTAARFDCPAGTTTFRNGTNVNPTCFTTITEPRVGQTWESKVTHSGHPGATLTMVAVYAGPATGPVKGYGEVLIDFGSGKIAQSLLPATGAADTHAFAVPADVDLVGLTGSSQGAIFGGAGPELCNALDLHLGF